ncbi:MAG: DNA replication/repair protein RecF [Bacteroidales bacterium]
MHLEHISLTNFKNIRSLELVPAKKLTCFVGHNGSGKTNLLDALYLLSMCKSSSGLTEKQCVCYDENFFLVKGSYKIDGVLNAISCGYMPSSGKIIQRNGKEYDRIADHIGLLPIVLISPADIRLIDDSGEERRKYLNGVLSQQDRRYLSAITQYNAILQQRNKLLKTVQNLNVDVLDILDMQMGEAAQVVFEKRVQWVDAVRPIFQQIYQQIADDKEEVDLHYVSDLHEDNLRSLLQKNISKDKVLQHTSVGVHRDDLRMMLNKNPLKKYGSQGQQKSAVLAIKLAQTQLMQQHLGTAPMLLLDDIFDKLDMLRVKNLIGVVSHSTFGQIFLTDSNKVRLSSILEEVDWEHKVFEVNNGAFTLVE